MSKQCLNCETLFQEEELKLNEKGFGCPKCGNLNYVEDRARGPIKWEDAKVKYLEGHHD